MGYFDGFDQAYIDAMNQEYANAKVPESYGSLPDGNYQAYVDKFLLKDSKKVPGEFGLYIELVVVDGEYAGRRVTKYTAISVDRMEHLKRDLNVLGFQDDGDLTNLDDDNRRMDMLDRVVDITIKRAPSKKDPTKSYTNIYLNRMVGMYEHPAENSNEPDYNYGSTPWGGR